MSLSDIRYIHMINPRSILDIGAHVGHWAKEAQLVWPKAKLTCIEGNLACEPSLRASGFEYKIAMLGSSFRTQTYYKQPGTEFGTGNSLFRELTPFFDDCTTEAAQVVPLESLFDDQVWEFIKCDVQGAELDVMRGGLEIFKRANHILLEVAYERYNEGAPMAGEVIAFMAELGFPKQKFVGNIVHPISRNVVQQDVLFSK